MNMITLDYIAIDSTVCAGKPHVAGTRVGVETIVVLNEFRGWDVAMIAAELELTLAQVHAALAYYHDHRESILESIRRGDETVISAGKSLHDFLAERRKSTSPQD